MDFQETISLTFGDCGENHVGMEKVGSLVSKGDGFHLSDLQKYSSIFKSLGCICELYDLKDNISMAIDGNTKNRIDNAYVLVIRNGLDCLLKKNSKSIKELYEQLNRFEWDRKYFDTRRQKVLNKHARANVCFGENGFDPDYKNKKGRVVSYNDVDCLKIIKENIQELMGEKCSNMICEGNRYFDIKKCGIGYHGDSERRKVIAFRIGATMNLHYNWFFKSKHIGHTHKLTLNNGDMYIMSEKAVGNDWKKKNIYTLRHAAGIEGCKYLKLKEN